MGSPSYGVGAKRGMLFAVVPCTFVLTGRRVGEPDRTESSAIAAVRAIQSAGS